MELSRRAKDEKRSIAKSEGISTAAIGCIAWLGLGRIASIIKSVICWAAPHEFFARRKLDLLGGTERTNRPNETEISHGRVSWPALWTYFGIRPVGFIDWLGGLCGELIGVVLSPKSEAARAWLHAWSRWR